MWGDFVKYHIQEGNYVRMGAYLNRNGEITFTFDALKEDNCVVLLSNISTKEQIRIDVPNEYSKGNLRSITIQGVELSDVQYLFEINGQAQRDPYAHQFSDDDKWCLIPDGEFDWGDDKAPEVPKSQMIMYKLHVRGFTMDEGVELEHAGTFYALMNKVNYLKSLGVTTVEFMPLYEFDERALDSSKINYWGYQEGNYFAVKKSYAFDKKYADVEFKKLIKCFHEHEIECIMEMYFTGNTNPNLIIDALHYWVNEYHVDGFHLLGEEIPIRQLIQDARLGRTKIFYYDIPILKSLHAKKFHNLFIYKEEYQYPIRQMLNHYPVSMNDFIDQQKKQGQQLGYINFVSSNNGFTLADVFMYNDKHNEENGEDNCDGTDWNYSNNYGTEGASEDLNILAIRKKMWKNAITLLLLAQGVPMIWQGDEICNSQKGNNNAYCQDNSIGWLNWESAIRNEQELSFVKNMVNFRKKNPILSKESPFQFSDYEKKGVPDVSYHGKEAWLLAIDSKQKSIGVMYSKEYEKGQENDIYIAYNFYSSKVTLVLPKLKQGAKWFLAIDTADDEMPVKKKEILCLEQKNICLEPQSICVLVGK